MNWLLRRASRQVREQFAKDGIDVSTWDDKPNDYEHALAEIKRLREDMAIRDQNLDHYVVMIKEQRNATIEECARVAASFHAYEVADAIRAKKGSPIDTPPEKCKR